MSKMITEVETQKTLSTEGKEPQPTMEQKFQQTEERQGQEKERQERPMTEGQMLQPTEKQETLANLYTLRAGLSVMSEICDLQKQAEDGIDIRQGCIKSYKEAKDRALSHIEEQKKDHDDAMGALSSRIKSHGTARLRDLELQKEIAKEERAEFDICGAHIFKWRKDWQLIWKVPVALLCWYLVGAFTIFAFWIYRIANYMGPTIRIKKIDKDIEEARQRIAREVEQMKKELKAQQLLRDIKFARFEQEYLELEQQGNDEIAKLEDSIKRIETDEIDLINQQFAQVYASVREQFTPILDERDWCNLDLIIFSYETGRAADLRDALIQVDTERRNERLIKAVEQASRSIASSIRYGFGEMTRVMSNKLDALDRSISGLAGSIGTYAAQTAEQGQAMKSTLDRLAATASSQEALQRKANESSDKLARDVAYMRDISERTYFGY